jgi:hypothetical protein
MGIGECRFCGDQCGKSHNLHKRHVGNRDAKEWQCGYRRALSFRLFYPPRCARSVTGQGDYAALLKSVRRQSGGDTLTVLELSRSAPL